MFTWRIDTCRRKLARLHRDQRGTISVLTVFAAMILTMLLGMVMNVGRHADGKVRMQNAADAAAYSGGAVVARGMNALAFTNHLLSDVFAMTAFLREARDRNAEQYTPPILDAWAQLGPVFAGSPFPKFAALGQAITAKVPLERDLVGRYGDWGAAVSERILPLLEEILEGELIPQYQRAVVAVFPDIAQAAVQEAARLHGRLDRGRGEMLAVLWRTTGQPVGGAAEMPDPTLPVIDPVAYAAVDPRYFNEARRERNELARRYLNDWNRQAMYFFDRQGKMSQFGALWRSFTCGQLERLFEENAMRNLPHMIREDLTDVVRQNAETGYTAVADYNMHLERHFTFVAVAYWEQLPELLPGLFRNPAEADSQTYAAVQVFVPRPRLIWHYVVPGQSDNPIGGMPGDFPDMPSPPGTDDGSGGGAGGRWTVGRQPVPTHWDLWNQHWSVQLVPAVQASIPGILQTPPPLPDFAARNMRMPNLGGLTGYDLRQINTH
jgi:hypothetical protein